MSQTVFSKRLNNRNTLSGKVRNVPSPENTIWLLKVRHGRGCSKDVGLQPNGGMMEWVAMGPHHPTSIVFHPHVPGKLPVFEPKNYLNFLNIRGAWKLPWPKLVQRWRPYSYQRWCLASDKKPNFQASKDRRTRQQVLLEDGALSYRHCCSHGPGDTYA